MSQAETLVRAVYGIHSTPSQCGPGLRCLCIPCNQLCVCSPAPQINQIVALSQGDASQLNEQLAKADETLTDIASDAGKLTAALETLDPCSHSLGWLYILCGPDWLLAQPRAPSRAPPLTRLDSLPRVHHFSEAPLLAAPAQRRELLAAAPAAPRLRRPRRALPGRLLPLPNQARPRALCAPHPLLPKPTPPPPARPAPRPDPP